MTFSAIVNAQSVIQSVNSGSVVSASSSVSIGEIVVVPENTSQSITGIIGILTQVNAQTLEVAQFDVSENVTAFPNPTTSKLFFESTRNLTNQRVLIYNELGQMVAEKSIDAKNSLDLESLSTGIYTVQFNNKQFKSLKIIKK